MTLAAEAQGAPRTTATWPWAALITLIVGALCLVLEPLAPWLIKFPATWTLPAVEWVGAALDVGLNAVKPGMRLLSALLEYPMNAANWLLNATPAPLLIGLTTALGWHLGGWRLAALGGIGLGFVLASGYWSQGMNTLALVFVSVPVAIIVGGTLGILANEFPRIRSALLAFLDAMQTIPTFAYLTPLLLLFGFGPVVGLIASAIYAAPPMARNTLLGLERVGSEIREAAAMSGATRLQQLFLVEIPAAGRQIMVGVNQCLMASLSMVIIAAVIGGFDDIGWEVLLTMRKALFGEALMAGLVIVTFALIIDRMSATLTAERLNYDPRVAIAFALIGLIATFALPATLVSDGLLSGISDAIESGLSAFTAANGPSLTEAKNTAMFYGLLPLRIGLDEAVLPFTWGFQWTAQMSLALFAASAVVALILAATGRLTAAAFVLIVAGVLETGIAQLPWPFVLTATAALAWRAGGLRLAVLCTALLTTVLLSGLWERALLSLYLSGAAVLACAVVGGALGLASAVWLPVWRVMQPVCDMLQTIPLFVFLIPVLMFFQIGEFSAFLAICAYAIVPMIRYTRAGLTETPPEMIEAATAAGATGWQILRDVRAPYAAPTILLGLNQTILYAFAMLVIAALIGTTGLGQSIYLALGQADVGLGVSAGAAMAILAFIADRLLQGFASSRRAALGL